MAGETTAGHIWVKYPDLVYPDELPQDTAEYDIYVQEKRDGSNISIWWDGDGNTMISSRNRKTADKHLRQLLSETEEGRKWINLFPQQHQAGRYVVFGELIPPGYGPTKIEGYNNKASYILFDIYDRELGGFIRPEKIYEIAGSLGVPAVAQLGYLPQTTIADALKRIAGEIIPYIPSNREGVVLKLFKPGNNIASYFAKIRFHIKLSETKKAGRPRPETTDMTLPPITEEKITRAIYNCLHTEFGGDLMKFRDKTQAMPLVVKYVALECREHGFSMPAGNKIYQTYTKFIRDETGLS